MDRRRRRRRRRKVAFIDLAAMPQVITQFRIDLDENFVP